MIHRRAIRIRVCFTRQGLHWRRCGTRARADRSGRSCFWLAAAFVRTFRLLDTPRLRIFVHLFVVGVGVVTSLALGSPCEGAITSSIAEGRYAIDLVLVGLELSRSESRGRLQHQRGRQCALRCSGCISSKASHPNKRGERTSRSSAKLRGKTLRGCTMLAVRACDVATRSIACFALLQSMRSRLTPAI